MFRRQLEADDPRAIDRIVWIAEMWITSLGYIGLMVGTLAGATWRARVRDPEATRERSGYGDRVTR